MRCEDGSCLSLLPSLGISFPLTPTLSLGERVPRRLSLEWPARLDLSQRGKCFSLSPRERVGVRGKRCSDKPMLNLMAVTLALPNTHQSNISIWNGRSTGSDLSSPGTSLEVPWYNPGTILVP